MINQNNPGVDETLPTVGPATSPLATTTDQQGTQQDNPVKKKKCHGQRKKQRYRRQLYAQGLSSATVNRLVDERFSSTAPSQESDTLDFNPSIPLDRVCFFRIPVYLSIGT
jgi:hypothetical protein